jgi:uncharacterized protein (DUF2249 family)
MLGKAAVNMREIDLCLLQRAERHPLVFDAFDALAVGDSFVIFNDHDPHPLRMQIEQLREGEMRWEYVERGPVTFRVRVTRVAPPADRRGAVGAGTAEQPVTIG